MIISGLQKFSLLDYPGCISAIIFTQGCNFRCQFCYNPMLVWPTEPGKSIDTASPDDGVAVKKGHPLKNEGDLFSFLNSRIGKLDAVVITGGEPTIHKDLTEFIIRIRKLGFKVKLDTNGANPDVLSELINGKLIDYIALDIKGPLNKYNFITGTQVALPDLKKSIKIIVEGGIAHEFRTTLVPGLHEEPDIIEMGELIKDGDNWYLQAFKSDLALVNPDFEGVKPYTVKEMEKMKKLGKRYVKQCKIR